ncbi:YciI family protein [Kaistella sp. 97-N-M2]|uniref:YciI family protein n=1 Tax=Kaistella sp. 97-N-M2 TaxID=2908645 RepID=UPI001F486CE0|nr:YciI family protein [Kaistella sp. 97-N-M2]UJF29128.1 YciI family protein [Kaistella sp. 97-N-M2]
MKAVVFYEHADAPMERFMEVFPKHQVVEDEFIKSGRVLGTGAFSVPGEGAMAIFVDKPAAEDFVKRDPFVLEGLIAKVTIREWDDELM